MLTSTHFRAEPLLVTVVVLAFTSAGPSWSNRTVQATLRPQQDRTSQVAEAISGWPKAAQEAASFMTKKYGPPAAVTADMLIWGKTGDWKRTIIYRLEYPHQFPAPHIDVMQQWIDYQADPKKFDELAIYDGSVVVERTSGEMSARCDSEAANFLALNLADEVATGKRSVDEAREIYGEQLTAMKAGQPAPLTERILILPIQGTNDPGKSLKRIG